MTDLIIVEPVNKGLQNTKEKVAFRQKILNFQGVMQKEIEAGNIPDTLPDCTLKHFFTDKSETYGCHVYAREMFIPKDTVIVGKIHRHAHLNFITKGAVIVSTEHGQVRYDAPSTFISEVGLKRAVVAVEDTLWTTVHLTGVADENKIEDELIAPTYEEMALIDNMEKLAQLEGK